MLNIGLESIQPKVSTEAEMSIEELIDFATAVGMYSDEINQDFKVLDQHILAVENLISVLNNLKEHGVTPALESLVGDQIELSETSLENFITEGIKKVIEFIKGIIKKIKEFFTGSDNVEKIAKDTKDTVESIAKEEGSQERRYTIHVLNLVARKVFSIQDSTPTSASIEHELNVIDLMADNCVKHLKQGYIRTVEDRGTKIPMEFDDEQFADELAILGNNIRLIAHGATIDQMKQVVDITHKFLSNRKTIIAKFEQIVSNIKVDAYSEDHQNMINGIVKGQLTQLLGTLNRGMERAIKSLMDIRKCRSTERTFDK